MKLTYLAPEGSFSHDAAVEVVSRFQIVAELSPLPNVERVARSVAGPQRDPILGLVPYYNFLEGLVQEHLDLIYEFDLRIIGLVRLPIQLSAGTFDTPPASATEVFSHPKALAQVSEFIGMSLEHAALMPVASTSEAVRMVSEKRTGIAIASETALDKFRVPIFARNIGNRRHGKNNFTDFLIVKSYEVDISVDFGAPDHAMVVITPDIERLGLLAELLGQFASYGLEIAKIHSRPAIDPVERAEEPQMFYLEVKCAPDAEALLRCAQAMQYRFGHADPSGDLLRVMGGFRKQPWTH
jgi:chorismate mutase / prephenate dehydratase